ncbi:NAD(P)-binding protein [Ramicandelaber brevisporus]|nr:NAD(P)-binding protein [Ramicandelaber brevisporus]
MSVKGKVAVITGGASGFGKGLADRLLSMGAFVVIGDISVDQGKLTALELGVKHKTSEQIPIVFQKCDVTKQEDIDALIQLAVDEFKGFDIMVNNAGVAHGGKLWEKDCDEREWRQMVDINLMAVAIGTRLALRRWIDKLEVDGPVDGVEEGVTNGIILNTASMAAYAPLSMMPVYGFCKVAVVHMTAGLAAYKEKYGIRVNAVAPYFAPTPLVLRELDGEPNLRLLLEASGWITVDQVLDAMVRGITDESLSGDILTITPDEGIQLVQEKPIMKGML